MDWNRNSSTIVKNTTASTRTSTAPFSTDLLQSRESNCPSLPAFYLVASHTIDYQNPTLLLNITAVFVLVIAALPHMHKVSIFGINVEE
ncbi:ORMDL-like protein [Cynara cardunculus var. scolymus]|uniref:ORMDL-like protein n=1 Tax=Cynara cardunculus var. scolymus TaxID=59895 RepID=A0A118JSD1_CYNCS|nr:ORMDL-like protein [Cynara cardunculus var. scolymus]